ncbi:DUF4411 family protein [Variovorax sp. GT1P44]|uniref:DUF4411 family protein n=1 Tax=Variovorax sp. GT1P44 TaxID=3443742 RepID=UPI003F479CC2
MNPNVKYLVDANVFIQAKDMYYRFDFCGGFWTWLGLAHDAGIVYSCKKVLAELTTKQVPDAVHNWAVAQPPGFFLDDVRNPAVMAHYANIMQWAQRSHFHAAAIAEFSRATVADAFLLAVAKHHGYTIATQEKSSPDARKKIFLPDAALAHGVKTVYVYDMLSQLAASTFVMKQGGASPALAINATP